VTVFASAYPAVGHRVRAGGVSAPARSERRQPARPGGFDGRTGTPRDMAKGRRTQREEQRIEELTPMGPRRPVQSGLIGAALRRAAVA
jgi:hypothetical protein